MLLAEALNQGDTVDLDALMADLCSIEQELNTISKPNSTSRSQSKGQQRAAGGRSASTKHTGTSGGGSSGGSPAELWAFKTKSAVPKQFDTQCEEVRLLSFGILSDSSQL